MIINNYLFVYGTLLDDDNEFGRYLEHNCSFYAKGRLYDIGEYPGAVADALRPGYVYGSIYIMNDATETLKLLDDYEGFGEEQEQPNLFVREVIEVEIDVKKLACWVYLYNLATDNYPPVLSGKYLSK